MERTISQEERIRRAEEIYQRRRLSNSKGVRVSSASVNNKKIKVSLLRKMMMQLALCAVIYIIFYLIKNTNYIFSEDVIQKTRELLSYDINFQNIWTSIDTLIQENKDQIENQIETNIVQENEVEENNEKIENNTTEKSENQTVSEETKKENEEKTKIAGIGGSKKEETKETTESNNQTSSKKTQMEIDAEYIKENYKFKLPIKGTVTSRYGKREATEIISENHQGIDIGADTGTAIYAAIDGTVTLVAFDETDYRKSCRN